MIRVILVEDENLVRLGLKELLSLDPNIQVVADASDGQQALDVVELTEADVILMDVRLPYLSGVEVIRQLRQRGSSIPAVLITTFDDEDTFFHALQAGANGFIRKDTSLVELTAALGAAVRGERVLRPAITQSMRTALEMLRPSFESLDLPDPLTKKELEVLALMAAGLSNKEIAASLEVTEATIKTHASTIFSKMGVRDRVRAVLKGLERGYV